MSFIKEMLGFDNIAKSIENVAKEWIETGTEKAEASALMIKTLDPNGLMRRDISNTVRSLYKLYILVMMCLLIAYSFDLGNANQIEKAIEHIIDLFIPITAMFTTIVTASFGVNGLNSVKGK